MARMLSQLPLPLLPSGAAEIAPGVGLAAGGEGSGLVTVHGLATFAWDAGDEAGRRLAAVQLVRLRAASQGQVAEAFGVDPGTIWRWDQALAAGGVAGLVPARRGPKGASKLTPQLAARITGLDAAGATLREIAAATGVSTFSVRNALGRVPSAGRHAVAGAAEDSTGEDAGDGEQDPAAPVPVLPDPVGRDGERVLARWGLLGEGAGPVFTPGARYPLAGLLLALPALEGAGLLDAAREVYGQLRDGFYGLAATLLTLVFLALAGEPRAEGATRVPPRRRRRVLGLDRAPEVKTIRRKLAGLAAAGKAADLIMALARRPPRRPDALDSPGRVTGSLSNFLCKLGQSLSFCYLLRVISGAWSDGDAVAECDGECVHGCFPAVSACSAFSPVADQPVAVDMPAGDIPDPEVEQLYCCLVAGEMAAVLGYLPQLEVN